MASWRIRKWTSPKQLERSGRRQAIKDKSSDAALPYVRHKCDKMQTVYFEDPEEGSKKGWVRVNDPYCEEMQLWVVPSDADEDSPDTSSAPIFVPYKDFRPKPEVTITENSLQSIQPESPRVSPVRAPKKKVTFTPDVPVIENALAELVSSQQSKTPFYCSTMNVVYHVILNTVV
jgi:hypothetical protein